MEDGTQTTRMAGDITSEPLVSVITPVYNVEAYIYDYLESMQAQIHGQLEIICVDDGSPDSCGTILDEYAKSDSRFVVLHQANAGISAATNAGLDAATGRYIGFVDPDDWIEPDFVSDMVSTMMKANADIAVSNYYRNRKDAEEAMVNIGSIPEISEDSGDILRRAFEADTYRGFKMFLWNKLFRAEFFSSGQGLGLRMDTDLCTGADQLLVAKCLMAAERVAYIDKPLYHYRIREDSIMRDRRFSRRLGLEIALERIADMLEVAGYDDATIAMAKRFHTYYSSQLAEFALELRDASALEYSKGKMRRYLREYRESCAGFPERIERVDRILASNTTENGQIFQQVLGDIGDGFEVKR
jgi:glycosyltransferase involved in cell wall biosynthesis